MGEDTDFAALYGELGITTGVTPEQFRQAYRRRVAQLHPDQGGDAADVARLQELNRTYAAALAFLRTHGRLPGVPAGASSPADAAPAPAAARALDAPLAAPEPPRGKAGPGAASRWYTWLAVVAVVVLFVHACGGRSEGTAPVVATSFDTAVEDALGIDRIRLGMGRARVKQIQGEPTGRRDIRWDYGPSWIDFRCGGTVTDWYSSPLRPLRVDTAHPTTAEWERYDAAKPHGC